MIQSNLTPLILGRFNTKGSKAGGREFKGIWGVKKKRIEKGAKWCENVPCTFSSDSNSIPLLWEIKQERVKSMTKWFLSIFFSVQQCRLSQTKIVPYFHFINHYIWIFNNKKSKKLSQRGLMLLLVVLQIIKRISLHFYLVYSI